MCVCVCVLTFFLVADADYALDRRANVTPFSRRALAHLRARRIRRRHSGRISSLSTEVIRKTFHSTPNHDHHSTNHNHYPHPPTNTNYHFIVLKNITRTSTHSPMIPVVRSSSVARSAPLTGSDVAGLVWAMGASITAAAALVLTRAMGTTVAIPWPKLILVQVLALHS